MIMANTQKLTVFTYLDISDSLESFLQSGLTYENFYNFSEIIYFVGAA